jgi:hypothetical protein
MAHVTRRDVHEGKVEKRSGRSRKRRHVSNDVGDESRKIIAHTVVVIEIG